MTIERATEVFAVINFAAAGVSHIVQPRVWVDFFSVLRQRGHAGVFMNGMLSLFMGSIIVSFHNVWSGAGMVLTLLGWMQVTKGVIALVLPAVVMKGMQRTSNERAWEIQVSGAAFLVLCAAIAWSWR